jgi:predicted transcriptional regulator
MGGIKMETIMISNKPKSAEQIMNGKKKIDVRKFYIEPPFKVLNYVTKEKPYIKDFATYNAEHCKGKNYNRFISFNEQYNNNYTINGKVAFEYVVNRVDMYLICKNLYNEMYFATIGELEQACLTQKEIREYGKGKPIYGWYISDLKIYDKPKELNNFKKPDCEKAEMHGCACLNRKCEYYRASNDYDYPPDCAYEQDITRPPQNFVYCEVVE